MTEDEVRSSASIEEEMFLDIAGAAATEGPPQTAVGPNWLVLVKLALDEQFTVGPNGEILDAFWASGQKAVHIAEEYKRPIPIPDAASAAYWEGAKRHELTIKHCNDCGYYIHYPKTRCPRCWSTNVGDAVVSGRAI